MNNKWETRCGDEWWLKNTWGTASASCAANIFSIESVKILSGQLTEQRLHEFLYLTWQQIKDASILLSLSVSSLEPVLDSLAQQGIVEYQVVESRYFRQARITRIST